MGKKLIIKHPVPLRYTRKDIVGILRNVNKRKTIRLVLADTGHLSVLDYNKEEDIEKFKKSGYTVYWEFERYKGFHGEDMMLNDDSDVIDEIYNKATETRVAYRKKRAQSEPVKIHFTKETIAKLLNDTDRRRTFRLLLKKEGTFQVVYYDWEHEIKDYEKLDYIYYWDNFGLDADFSEDSEIINSIYNKAKDLYERRVKTRRSTGVLRKGKVTKIGSEGLPQGYIDSLKERLPKQQSENRIRKIPIKK